MVGRRSLVLALLALALAGCGGSGRLATIGDRTVTRDQVQQLVDHGRDEATREGNTFPAKGSGGYRQLEQQALAILVSRAQIARAAARLGVTVSDAEVAQHAAVPQKDLIETLYENTRRKLGIPETNPKGEGAKLLADAVRVQLTLQKVERRVGAKRLQGWVASARKLPVDYAEGWAP
jgi:predicted small lipoprotein YifL